METPASGTLQRTLKTLLAEWTDIDYAGVYLGYILGLFPSTENFGGEKWLAFATIGNSELFSNKCEAVNCIISKIGCFGRIIRQEI